MAITLPACSQPTRSPDEYGASRNDAPHGRVGIAVSSPTLPDSGAAHVWTLYGPLGTGRCKVVENPTCPPDVETCTIQVPEVECPAGSDKHTGTITQPIGSTECTLAWTEWGDTSCPSGRRCSPPHQIARAVKVGCPR